LQIPFTLPEGMVHKMSKKFTVEQKEQIACPNYFLLYTLFENTILGKIDFDLSIYQML
jgi:hypothetical protein